MVGGLHREEFQELFMKEAAGEMLHVRAFSDLIIGLGGTPNPVCNPFPTDLTRPTDIVKYALEMESEVVANYVDRMKDAASLKEIDAVNGEWISIFLEEQIMKSRQDVDNLRKMLRDN